MIDLDQVTTRALTRRRLLATGSAAALVLAGCGGSDSSSSKPKKAAAAKVDGDITVLMWEAYIPDEVISSFEKEHGAKVTKSYFSTEEEMLKKLASGQPYDIAFIASNYLSRAVEANLLRPIDHGALKNANEILPYFEVPPYEPDEKLNKRNADYVGMPYAMGGVGINWRTDKLGDELTGSFNDLWDNKDKAKGHMFLWDDLQFTLAVGLAKTGHDINSGDPAELKEAADALRELKPSLAGFGGTTDIQSIANGRSWLGMAYTGTVFAALGTTENPDNIMWQAARESQIYNDDNVVIPAAAKSPGTATLFTDWMLAPENMKKIVGSIGYVLPTKTGVEAYKELTADYPWLSTQEKLMQDSSQWLASLTGERLQLWQRTWQDVKAG
jgi:spermidine/putrescine-binding protein